jgi:hypothetical protein
MPKEESTHNTTADCPVLVRINLLDCFASSTKVKVDKSRTANDICEILSTKLGLTETDAMFYGLVCVAKCVDKKSMHWVRTLKANEKVLQVQADMELKAVGRCATSEIAQTVTSSFYYKDIRSNPLDLDGDASGNSSSDDESEIPLNDLMYFGSGERRGFLQKRSSRDPNVWRRRLCILNDKLWCINVRKNIPWASCVKLNDTTVLEDRPDLKYSNTITLSGNNGQTLFFRTNAPLEKHRWREEIRERTLYGAENEVIMMAEMIITDEEQMGEMQMQKCFLQVLHTPQVWQLVVRILDLTPYTSTGSAAAEMETRADHQQQQGERNGDGDGDGLVRTQGQSRGRSQAMDNAPSSSSSSVSRGGSSGKSSGSLSPPRGSPRRAHHSREHREGAHRRTNSLRSDMDSSSGTSKGKRTVSSHRFSSSSGSTGGGSSPPPPGDQAHVPLPLPLHLSKKIGRWPYQIFHLLHQKNPACAAGVSLICAVQHFRGSFRHDFYLRPKELWGNALHVYIHYILPYMDFIKVDSGSDLPSDPPVVVSIRQESVDEMEHRKGSSLERDLTSRPSVAMTPSRHISMDAITQLHRALFSNIRKKRKKNAVEAASTGSDAPSSPSFSSWFWSSSSSEKSTASSSASSSPCSNKLEPDTENDIYNTDYEILDNSIKPDIEMYDEFVQAIYRKMEEVVA